MTVQNKDKQDLNPQDPAPQSADNPEDLDKIMNEIEELQQNMEPVSSPKAEAIQKPQTSQKQKANATASPTVASVQQPLTPTQASAPDPAAPDGGDTKRRVVPITESKEKRAAVAPPAPAPEKDQSAAEDILKEMSGSSEEPWLEETLSQLSSETGTAPKSYDETSHDDLDSEPGASLSMAVRGKMTVKLNYDHDQSVWIAMQNDTLQIRLADGTEFKIPVRTKSLRKVA